MSIFSSHSFSVEMATKYGVNEAIFLNNLQHWISYHKAHGTNFHEGRTWNYNTYEAFAKLFPYFNARQIKHLVKKLVDRNVIIKKKIKASESDHTNWYAFADEDIFFPKVIHNQEQICPIDQTNLSHHDRTNLSDLLNTDIYTDNKLTMSGKPDTEILIDKFREEIEKGITHEFLNDAHKIYKINELAIFVLTYFNCINNSYYQPVESTLKPIVGRLRERYTLKQCIAVIHQRRRKWKDDDKMREYNRPKTIFNATNFNNYVGMIDPLSLEE